MDATELYELMLEASRQAIRESAGGDDIRISRRMVGGKVLFEDGVGKQVKEVDVFTLFRKVTAVRDRLRVLEQKVNSTESIDPADRAELQGYITKAYGSLTTFNFLFSEDEDRFQGTGGA